MSSFCNLGQRDPQFFSPHILQFATIIFFNAFIQVLYHFGIMQWIIKNFAWFFFKTMNVSGAEAVVAASSPFVGASESVCLVRPFIEVMTESEIHLILASGKLFCDIEGAFLSVEPSKDSPPLLALS
jgi:CNT family concentrative nucleoside transporter